MNGIADPTFRQAVRDFCVNQQFRKDYWVKGSRAITPLEQADRLREAAVVLAQPRAKVPLKIKGNLGEATLHEEVYGPILDCLSDHKIRTIGQIEAAVKDKGITLGQVRQAVVMLVSNGSLLPAQSGAELRQSIQSAASLNDHLMSASRSTNGLNYLASPVIGGGIGVTRMQQLFLLARKQGRKTPADWAAFAAEILAAQGQKLVKAGKPLDTAEENLRELIGQAEEFAAEMLPVLKGLMVA